MVRLIGFPTRETNSSHASSSQVPAQRQTMSFRDKDEYRFVSEEFDILLFLFRIGAVDKDKRHSTDHENDA